MVSVIYNAILKKNLSFSECCYRDIKCNVIIEHNKTRITMATAVMINKLKNI